MAISFTITSTIISLLVLHLCFMGLLVVLLILGKIFGAAQGKKPIYIVYVFSIILLALSSVGLFFLHEGTLSWVIPLLNTIALTLASIATYFYWNWLPKEIKKG